jgi:gluconate transporter
MQLIILAGGIVLLLVLISGFKVNAFFSLLITAFLIGIANGMGALDSLNSVTKGIGEIMGKLALILTFGAMFGRLIDESGAAKQISDRMVSIFGTGRIQYAVLLTGLVVGLPMMYNASFLVLIPLIYALAKSSKLNMLYIGIPLSASLSVAHAFLPPHPIATSVALAYGANVNKVLLYGLFIAIPAMLLAGPFLSRFFKKLDNHPPEGLYSGNTPDSAVLPSFSLSLFTALVPVILILTGALMQFFLETGSPALKVAGFIANPTIALFAAVFVGIWLLGLNQQRKMEEVMKSLSSSVGSIAMILLIIASGGALKQVLTDSGISIYIQGLVQNMQFSPLIMAWVVAALLRLAIGSATVSAITTAGIMLPVASQTGTSFELMALATGAGSLMFSHFNDIGFWMFKEYFNATIKQTFSIWSVMESIVAVVGLVGVLLIEYYSA